MAISIHELRKPKASENPWQYATEYPQGEPTKARRSSAYAHQPFSLSSPAPAAFPRATATSAYPLPPVERPRSRGILKFVNYLYDLQ